MEKLTTTSHKEILAGIFNNKESAAKALLDLNNSGYSADEINVVVSKDTKARLFENDDQSFYFGLKNGQLNLCIFEPGMPARVNRLATLNESGFPGESAGIRAVLIGAGIPVEQALICNEGVKNGKILLTVNPKNEDDLEYLSYKWNQYCAEEVYS